MVTLVLLGYLYPLLLLGVSVAAFIWALSLIPVAFRSDFSFVYFAVMVGFLLLSVLILQAFWVTHKDLNPVELREDEAPALRKMIDEVRVSLNAPPVHRIYFNYDLNASVASHRQFGFWGSHRNRLMIGLPLMHATTPGQFRGVLVHEFAHLRSGHANVNVWMYRVNETWESLGKMFRTASRVRWWLLGWFVERYSAYLAESTLPLRRRHEHDADRSIASICGADCAADVLGRIDGLGDRLEKDFWPAVWRESALQPLPRGNIIVRICEFLSGAPDPQFVRRYQARELSKRTPIASDHPCLLDRLSALDRADQLKNERWVNHILGGIPPIEESAVALLGTAATRLDASAAAMWKTLTIENWRNHHAAAKVGMEILSDEDAELTDEERRWEEVRATANCLSRDEAIAALEAFLRNSPDHAEANFTIGRLYMDADSPLFVPSFERAMSASEFIAPSLTLMLEYHRAMGRDDQGDPVLQRLEAHQHELKLAQRERVRLRRTDRLLPHDFKPRELTKLRRMLSFYPQINAAWLARKEVRFLKDRSGYVLILNLRATALPEPRTRRWLAQSLQSQFAVPMAVDFVGWRSFRLKRRIRNVCHEPIFSGRS